MKVWRCVFAVVLAGAVVAGFGINAYGQAGDKMPECTAFDAGKPPFYQELTTDTTQTMKVDGMEVVQKQKQTFWVKWTPPKDAKDPVEFKIVGVMMDIQIGGTDIAFDSRKEQAPDNPLTQFFKALVGSDFKYTIAKDKAGLLTVTKVENVDTFVRKLAAANEQLEGLLKNILSEDALKQMANPIFGVYPPTEAKFKDGKWESTSTISMGPIGSYKTDYIYSKGAVKDKAQTLTVTGTMTYTPPKDNAAGSGLPFSIKEGDKTFLKADSISGDVMLDLTKGRIKESEIKMKLSGSLKIDIAGVETVVGLTQDQTSKMKSMDENPIPEKKK